MRCDGCGLFAGLLVAAALGAGCREDDPMLEPQAIDGALWRGAFDGGGTCGDGTLEMQLAEVDRGWFEGSYRYESVDGYVALYAVSGDLDEVSGVLTLDQIDREAEPLPDARRWCYGTLEIGLDPYSGALSGGWSSQDCGCEGSLSLE